MSFWPESASTKTIITLKEGSNQISLSDGFKSPRYSRRVTSSNWCQEPLNLQEWLIFVYRQKRKPHFISKVTRLLEKYKDREYVLIENVMKKYRIKEKDLPVPILRTLRNQRKRNFGTECWNGAIDASTEVERPLEQRKPSVGGATMPAKRIAQNVKSAVPEQKPRVSKLKRRASPIKITRSRRRSFDPVSDSQVSPSPVPVPDVPSSRLVSSATVSAAPSLQPSAGTPRQTSTPDSWVLEDMQDSGSNEELHRSDVHVKALIREVAELRRITETTQRKIELLVQYGSENKRLRQKIKKLEHKQNTKQVDLDGVWCQDDEKIECQGGKLPFGELVLCKPLVSWQNNGIMQCQGQYDAVKRSIVWDDGTEWFWQDPKERPNLNEPRRSKSSQKQLDVLRDNIRNSRSRRSSRSSLKYSREMPRRSRRKYSDDIDAKYPSTSPIESRI